jgi:hypothetical protein
MMCVCTSSSSQPLSSLSFVEGGGLFGGGGDGDVCFEAVGWGTEEVGLRGDLGGWAGGGGDLALLVAPLGGSILIAWSQ